MTHPSTAVGLCTRACFSISYDRDEILIPRLFPLKGVLRLGHDTYVFCSYDHTISRM